MQKITYQDYYRYLINKTRSFLNYNNQNRSSNYGENNEESIDHSCILHEDLETYKCSKNNTDKDNTNKDNTDENNKSNKHNVNNEHDKIFKTILDDKKEASKFITKTLKLGYDIKPEEIEKYNSSFVTQDLKSQESDIVYKLKGRNIFFLIEHQTKIDYSMPMRILEYSFAIIRGSVDYDKKYHKEYKFPAVIPIVLYSGSKKWNSKTYIKDAQEVLKEYKGIEIGKYNLVDVNDFSEEELLNEKTLLSKAMLIEKTRESRDLAIYVERIVKEVKKEKSEYTEEQIKVLTRIINLILRRKLDKDFTEKMIEELNKKEEKNMLAVLEMIDRENAMLIRKGRKEGKLEVAKKMLEEGISFEKILKITGLKKEEVQKIIES